MARKPTIRFDGLKTKEFDEDIRKLLKVVATNPGIAKSLDKGLQETVIPAARGNVWALFNTSGDFPSRIDTRKVNQYRVDIVVNAPYGAVHEYGGTFIISKKQRGFFWARFAETRNTMWKALALSKSYTIPARPYLRPAIDAEKHNALKTAAQYLYRDWKMMVERD